MAGVSSNSEPDLPDASPNPSAASEIPPDLFIPADAAELADVPNILDLDIAPPAVLPRRSRGLDFARASTHLHHSTLAAPPVSDAGSPRPWPRPRSRIRHGHGHHHFRDPSGTILMRDSTSPEREDQESSCGVDGDCGDDDDDSEDSSSSSSEDYNSYNDSDTADRLDESMNTTPATNINNNNNDSNNSDPSAWLSITRTGFAHQRGRRTRGRPRPRPRTRSAAAATFVAPRGRPSLSRASPAGTGPPSPSPSLTSISPDGWPRRSSGGSITSLGQLGQPNFPLPGQGHPGSPASPIHPNSHVVVRRPVSRRGNLLPKSKNFARIRAALLEEGAPLDFEAKREAEVVRQVREREPNPGGSARGVSPVHVNPPQIPGLHPNPSLGSGPNLEPSLGPGTPTAGAGIGVGSGPVSGSASSAASTSAASTAPILPDSPNTRPGKRRRDEVIDMSSLKRRAVSPSISSTQNSPVPARTSYGIPDAAPPTPTGPPKRVGWQGMSETSDGFMNMRID